MNFGPDHYVPVLKVKRGEKKALQELPTDLRTSITPLLEIVARNGNKPLHAHLETAFKDLSEAVSGYERCFIDVREIAPDGANAATTVFQRATNESIVFTPVTGISRSSDVAPALAYSQNGIAIRLTRQEFEAGIIPMELPSFLSVHGILPSQIDLVIDLGPVDDMVLPGVIALATAFLAAVPNQGSWRTFTVSACAFPLSLSAIPRDSHGFAERMEWQTWRDHLRVNQSGTQRVPTFSDCAIQHTKGVEGFDPITMQGSAAIRYTLEDDWLIVKGVGTRSSRPGLQFPVLAQRLVNGSLSTHFQGSQHCSGCAGITAAAGGETGFGSLEIWRRLGTIHHMTTVAQALSALP